MKGIYYNGRTEDTGEYENLEEVRNALVLPKNDLIKFFEVKIQGKIDWRCKAGPDNCGDCEDCGNTVKVTAGVNGNLIAVYTDEPLTHRHIGKFHWDWSGHGVREWWFDDQAVCLVKTNDYRSGSGLTAESSRIVAYNRKIEVSSFRGDCVDTIEVIPQQGIIWAEFINGPAGYRSNWTGFAVGMMGGTPIIGDKLDDIIEIVLSGEEPGKPTVCRHNREVRAHIVCTDSEKLTSLYLCKSCRMRGVRWEEFLTRNQRDMCPYFRRACKSVIGKSDSFPEWFAWSGNNLLSAQRRMADGDYEAFEATYVRRKEGFVRRAVLLFNLRTREVRMYRYNGYIPPTLADFNEKYSEGRYILGHLGTGRKQYASSDDPDNGFLTEEAVKKAIQKGLENPLWQSDEGILIRFANNREDLERFAVKRGKIGGLQIVPLKEEGENEEVAATADPTPFYAENGTRFYLLRITNWQGKISIRRNSQELKRVERETGDWYFLGIKD